MLTVMFAIGEADDIEPVYRRFPTVPLSGTTILTASAYFTSGGMKCRFCIRPEN